MLGIVTNLSHKQRTFLLMYLQHGNATQAAREAGYASPEKQGPRLCKNPKIQEVIADYFREQEMAAVEVVARLSAQARAGYAAYLQNDGSVDLAGMIADGLGHLVKGTKETQWGLQVEFYDAQSALVHVGRYHGLFKDRQEHLFPDGQPITVIEVVKPDDDDAV